MTVFVKELSESDRPAMVTHFLALVGEDRRLRFGITRSDESVEKYVQTINLEKDAVFGVVDDLLRLIGVAHLARTDGYCEFGVSVLADSRNLGIGNALLQRSEIHSRNWGVTRLVMHCLAENRAILHLARKQNMKIATSAGETDTSLQLEEPSVGSRLKEIAQEQFALVDYALKEFLI
jgi:GNAT superfamily N-acetyltransferase